MRATVEQLTEEYQSNRSYYLGVASQVVGKDRCEDVVQTAFLLAFSSLGQFNGSAAFRTWMYAITRNAALDSLRRTRRHDSCLPIDQEIEAGLSSEEHRADRQIEIRQFHAQLMSAIESPRLTDQERGAIRYFLVSGQAMNRRTFKTWKYRAIQKLRKVMVQ